MGRGPHSTGSCTRCARLSQARHVVFYAMDDKGLTEGKGRYRFIYGTMTIHLASNPQTILALEMDKSLATGGALRHHSSPARDPARVLVVKSVAGIGFVADVTDIGQGAWGLARGPAVLRQYRRHLA